MGWLQSSLGEKLFSVNHETFSRPVYLQNTGFLLLSCSACMSLSMNWIVLQMLGRVFFIFRFTDPPDPIFWKLKKKIKEIFFQFFIFISLRLMPVQNWSSVMFFGFVFSIAARLIKLSPVTAPGEILPF